jgi:hypothetical protein
MSCQVIPPRIVPRSDIGGDEREGKGKERKGKEGGSMNR